MAIAIGGDITYAVAIDIHIFMPSLPTGTGDSIAILDVLVCTACSSGGIE